MQNTSASCSINYHNRLGLLIYLCLPGSQLDTAAAAGAGTRSASSANSPIVRTTRSTFSRNAFEVRRASRTVSVVNVLYVRRRSQSVSHIICHLLTGGSTHARYELAPIHSQRALDLVRLELPIDVDNLLCDGCVLCGRKRDAHRPVEIYHIGRTSLRGRMLAQSVLDRRARGSLHGVPSGLRTFGCARHGGWLQAKIGSRLRLLCCIHHACKFQ